MTDARAAIWPSRGNKYGARRTFSQLCNRWFASKAEAVRGEELALLERGGVIRDLQYQVRFRLSEKPKVTITIDFAYREDPVPADAMWKGLVLEDVKGVLTRDFRTKLAWLKRETGAEVRLLKGETQ